MNVETGNTSFLSGSNNAQFSSRNEGFFKFSLEENTMNSPY